MRIVTAMLIGCTALFYGCSPEDSAPPNTASKSPSVADVAQNYKQLRRLTTEPVKVNPEFAHLCVGYPSIEMVEEAQKKAGPHANCTVQIYMNDSAASAFQSASKIYPVGSIIVKEKKADGYRSSDYPRGTKLSDGVGGMIKRQPGYDSEHGDWEYFYFEDPKKIESGKIASCVQCHAGAAVTDHVFGSWSH